MIAFACGPTYKHSLVVSAPTRVASPWSMNQRSWRCEPAETSGVRALSAPVRAALATCGRCSGPHDCDIRRALRSKSHEKILLGTKK